MGEKGEEDTIRLAAVSDKGQFEKPKLRWEEKFKMDLKATGRSKWRANVDTVWVCMLHNVWKPS